MPGLALEIGLRYGAGEEPEPDPARTDPDGQARLIASWRAFWSGAAKSGKLRRLWRFSVGAPKPLPSPTLAVSQAIGEEADALRKAWSEQERAKPPVRGKHEHFFEDAALLDAAIRSGLPGVIMVRGEVAASLLAQDPAQGSTRISMGLGCDAPSGPEEGYWHNPAFVARAGRPFVECLPWNLGWVALAYAARGTRTLFIKSSATKVGVWRHDVDPMDPEPVVRSEIYAALGHSLFASDTYFVQPWFPFRREFRFAVVDHMIVKGVPVRRADTVLDATPGKRIEPRSCEAHDGHPSEPDRTRAAAAAAEARILVAALMREEARIRPCAPGARPGRGDYVIDIGEAEDGRMVPIEINSLSMAGRYACDPGDILRALVAKERRREAFDSQQEPDCDDRHAAG